MLLPAPEFDLLLDLANSNSAMVLPVSGEEGLGQGPSALLHPYLCWRSLALLQRAWTH
jgi:hypothetical protein